MVDFSAPVNAPSPVSYAAPRVDFAPIGNLYEDYFTAQQRQREADFVAQQRARDLALQQPINSNDPNAVAAELLRRGGAPYAAQLFPFLQDQRLLEQARQGSPLLPGAPGSAAPPASPTISPTGGVVSAARPAAPAQTQPVGGYTGGDAGTGTVAAIVDSRLPEDSPKTGAVIGNIAKTVGVDPNAPLSADQQNRVRQLVDAYAKRTGVVAPAPDATASAPASSGATPIIPAIPLPRGFSKGQEQEAIQALRLEAARLSNNKYTVPQANLLSDWASRIENSLKPITLGGRIISPTGQTLYAPPERNPANIALQRFLEENPNATPEQIQAFNQAGRRGGSAASQIVNRYLQEHPEASAEDIAKFVREQQVKTAEQKIVVAADARALSNSLSKLEQSKNALEAFEKTAIKNGEVLVQLAEKVDKTGVPALERWIRAGRRSIAGDTDVSNFNAQWLLFNTEAAKILTNPNMSGQLTDSARHEMAEAIPNASSAKQIREAFNLLKGDFGRRKQATDEQIAEVREKLKALGEGAPKTDSAPAQSAPSTPPASASSASLPPPPAGFNVVP